MKPTLRQEMWCYWYASINQWQNYLAGLSVSWDSIPYPSEAERSAIYSLMNAMRREILKIELQATTVICQLRDGPFAGQTFPCKWDTMVHQMLDRYPNLGIPNFEAQPKIHNYPRVNYVFIKHEYDVARDMMVRHMKFQPA